MAKQKQDDKKDTNEKNAKFQTHGRLLQELGERLVARADVALLELVKNAYDADATKCEVRMNGDSLVIADDGHGMTEKEFLTKWMEIATNDKTLKRQSRRYNRGLTGSKGIGRFAVRFLGRHLKLETIATAPASTRTKLIINFNWPALDSARNLDAVSIPYEIEKCPDEKSGTVLTISALKHDAGEIVTKDLRTSLLGIASAYSAFSKGRFSKKVSIDNDPGFNVVLPSEESDDSPADLVTEILSHYYMRLTVEGRKSIVKYKIVDKDDAILLEQSIATKSSIQNGFFADIRYFPKRKGMFANLNVDGRRAWSWIKDDRNNGIGIVDNGFRIRPYGFAEDDWLQLSYDAAHRRRHWRSSIMEAKFAMPEEALSNAKLNPMLYLPGSHQLVGAVFVESTSSVDENTPDLTPSMDREGFVENSSFIELRDHIRTGLEMLAYIDHQKKRKEEEVNRKKATKDLRNDFKQAAAFISKVPGLSSSDRRQVVDQFTTLAKQVDDVEEFYEVATARLELMSLLGVLAGFITHEMDRMLHHLEGTLSQVKALERQHPSIRKHRESIEESMDVILGHIDYAKAFVYSVQNKESKSGFSPKSAVELIAGQFKKFCVERSIDSDINIENNLKSPPVPRALYNGVIMNLYTNALKAAVGGISASKHARVTVNAWNTNDVHVVEFADSGIGIPPSLEKRIWEPFFTTSSSEYTPLGTGMGLGLTIVKRLLKEVDGEVELVKPPPGFKTCFRVTYPLRKK